MLISVLFLHDEMIIITCPQIQDRRCRVEYAWLKHHRLCSVPYSGPRCHLLITSGTPTPCSDPPRVLSLRAEVLLTAADSRCARATRWTAGRRGAGAARWCCRDLAGGGPREECVGPLLSMPEPDSPRSAAAISKPRGRIPWYRGAHSGLAREVRTMRGPTRRGSRPGPGGAEMRLNVRARGAARPKGGRRPTGNAAWLPPPGLRHRPRLASATGPVRRQQERWCRKPPRTPVDAKRSARSHNPSPRRLHRRCSPPHPRQRCSRPKPGRPAP
jgi:hypothetical protein